MNEKFIRLLEIMGLLFMVFLIDKLTNFEVDENTFIIALLVTLIMNQKRGKE